MITFDFAPKFFIVSNALDPSKSAGSSVPVCTGIWTTINYNGMNVFKSSSVAYNHTASAWSIHATANENTLSWHTGPSENGGSAEFQLNSSNLRWCWVAIG